MYKPGDTPRRSSSKAGSPIPVASMVERARVMNVNIRDFTVDIATEFTFKRKFDIPFMVPYCHQNQGEGINFMPEVGSMCWVCTPSEEGREAFVLGWTMVDEGGAYRGGRELLNPGDLHFSTRDGNFVFIRRGGIVQIGATPVCQRIFLPIRNIMQDFAENYEMHTPGGDLTWTVNRSDEDADGHKGTVFTLAAKEFADDPNEGPVALLKIGSHGEGNQTILTLLTRDKGGGAAKTTLEVTKAGEIKWSVQKVTWEVAGDFILKVLGIIGMDIQVPAGDFKVLAGKNLALAAANLSLAAGGVSFSLGPSGASVKGPKIDLGDPAGDPSGSIWPAVRMSPGFVAWIAAVTAKANLVPPLAPVIPLPPFAASPKVKV